MKPTDITKEHVITAHVNPARNSGQQTVQVRVGNIQKELGWTNRTPSVFSTLSSRDFQEEAGVELIEKKGGPSSGGPSTTVQFLYRILPQPGGMPGKANPTGHASSGGLLALYGICKDMYREDGGAEAFIRAQRENFGATDEKVKR